MDPEGAVEYSANLERYVRELDELDKEYSEAVTSAGKNTILFADRFPFAYLAHDYGLEHYAAFSGCSSESEASFEIIVELAGKIDELGLNAVIVTEGAEHKIAETVIATTATKDARILTMDSMQSTTIDDAENGASYLSIMRSNLSVLIEALG
jgi:zinc transport system substrate-binding protein